MDKVNNSLYEIYNADCFDVLGDIDDASVDLILVDPPYGTTSIKWDSVLDFDIMWNHISRVLKPNRNVILFGSQPFSSKVILSNEKWFKYELIWNKNKCGSPGLAKFRPQKVHENIMVFSNGVGIYNPIMEQGNPYKRFNPNGYGTGKNTHGYGFGNKNTGHTNDGTRYPKSIIHASRNFSAQQTIHPTQKPTNLLNWLIMTYSNKGDVVMDFTMGVGSCAVSSKLTGRYFIGIEKEAEYFNLAKKRLEFCEYDVVNENDIQLSTQLHGDIITLPDKSYESKFNKFIDSLNKDKNIVCHDALTDDYSFGDYGKAAEWFDFESVYK